MTLYLSRLVLDALDRQTLQTLASPNHLHQAVLDGFERGARGDRRVLYRLEPELERRTRGRVLLVQSEVEPDWSRRWQPWFGVPPLTAVRAMDPERWELQAGSALRFRLRANPTRRERGEGDRRPDGGCWRRFDLRGEWAQLEWLDMQATGQRRGRPIAGHGGHGFDFPARHEWFVRRTAGGPEERLWLPDVVANEVGLQQGLHRSDGSSARLFHRLVDFEGLLIVTDPPRFCEALRRGIGPAKAFGCGLLSVAPAG